MTATVTRPDPGGVPGTRVRLFRRLPQFDVLGLLSIVVLIALAVVAVFGRQLAPYDANQQDLLSRLAPPVWAEGGSFSHVFGTDQLGRDIFSRLLVGARLTLLIGFSTAAIQVGIGSVLGLIAGYRGRLADTVIMRMVDIQMGFPTVLIILLIILILGSRPSTLILAIGLNGWMIFARFIRGEVLRIKGEPFVQAAKVTGMSGFSVARTHVLPHLRGRLTALYLMQVPRNILTAAALSFLGIGVTPPAVSWGLIIGDTQSIISVAPWPSVLAGLAIVITTASLYVFASWAEPRVDPLRRRTAGRSRAAGGRPAIDDSARARDVASQTRP